MNSNNENSFMLSTNVWLLQPINSDSGNDDDGGASFFLPRHIQNNRDCRTHFDSAARVI